MKERPILFTGEMVRAILAGRKTQTRRVVKPQPDGQHGTEPFWRDGGYRAYHFRGLANPGGSVTNPMKSPYGERGDRLWVREAHALDGPRVFYRAGHQEHDAPGPRVDIRWRPSIHMPRWASRITLEITSVRVDRLHGITVSDAIAEGYDGSSESPLDPSIAWYANLWESINGPGSWRADPWVWVIEFRRVAQ